MSREQRKIESGDDSCGCVNSNICDCLRGGVELSVQRNLQELHRQSGCVTEEINDEESGVVNLAPLSTVKGAYF